MSKSMHPNPTLPGLDFALGNLQGFTDSIALYNLIKTGALDILADRERSADEISQELCCDEIALNSLLDYCCIAGYIARDSHGRFSLTKKGVPLLEAKGWINLIVGGYGEMLLNFHNAALRKVDPSSLVRNDDVGNGSCEMSKLGVFKVMEELLEIHFPAGVSLIADLGCGTGDFALKQLESNKCEKAVFVESSLDCTERIATFASATNLAERVEILNIEAEEAVNQIIRLEPELLVFSFVLHDILGSIGEEALQAILKKIAAELSQSRLLIAEVDNPEQSTMISRSIMGLGYYNSYFWTQKLTSQKIKSLDWWQAFLRKSGFLNVSIERVPKEADPLQLEFVLLAKPQPAT